MTGSHRQILRATSIIGGSSIVNVAVGLVRLKLAALLLGPVGVGLAGLLQNLMSTGSTVAALGVGTAGTRQIVEAKGRGAIALRTAECALLLGAAALAVVGGVAFWLLRRPLALLAFQDSGMASSMGWIGVGVGLTVLAGSQIALLTGLRRLGDVARVTIISAVLGSAVGIIALLLFGLPGVVWFVLAAPAASALVGGAYLLRAPRTAAPSPPIRALFSEWRSLLRLGAAFATASLVALGAQLVVRIAIQRQLGIPALGLFQASWAIAMTYVSFVLQAMATDYYPRLTENIRDRAAAARLVNDQAEVALFLGGPVLLAIIGIAPWLIRLLYSDAFTGAAELLRWQAVGDIAKLASWPVAFVILASGKGRTYMFTETAGALVLAGCTWLVIPVLGLEAAGIAYLASYLVYLALVHVLARRTIGFAWSRRVVRLLLSLTAAAILTWVAAATAPLFGAAAGLGLAAAFAVAALIVLEDSLPKPLAQLVGGFRGS